MIDLLIKLFDLVLSFSLVALMLLLVVVLPYLLLTSVPTNVAIIMVVTSGLVIYKLL